jgi:hypothetical protein
VFFGMDANDTNYDILTMHSIYYDLIPEDHLSIGDDGAGDTILISIDGDHFGKVFIWCKHGQVDEGDEPNFENLDLISETFGDFIDDF